jgi:TPR repeat protein
MGETVSECGNYTLRERREAGRQADIAARAEACYRIAVLRAVHFAEGEDRREAFSYLAKAVLMGHAAAREDLARMYAYETAYINATTPQSGRKRKDRATPAGVYARHRLDKRSVGSPSARDGRAGRSHNGWMNDYYTALWPVPALFKFAMEATSAPADRPAYVSAEVTPPMLAAALNYLGDCLFFGEGLPADPAAAASCYREVVRMRITVPRGEAPPNGLVWAQYSYGWCLLHGIGVPEQPREAVAYLTLAAKTHAEACYCLGECFEIGVGVDVADSVEAFKYYRKALKLGYRKVAPKVLALEKRLKAEG